MKKIFLTLLTLAMLAGCNNSNSNVSDSPSYVSNSFFVDVTYDNELNKANIVYYSVEFNSDNNSYSPMENEEKKPISNLYSYASFDDVLIPGDVAYYTSLGKGHIESPSDVLVVSATFHNVPDGGIDFICNEKVDGKNVVVHTYHQYNDNRAIPFALDSELNGVSFSSLSEGQTVYITYRKDQMYKNDYGVDYNYILCALAIYTSNPRAA